MALNKDINIGGNIFSYWRINHISLEPLNNRMIVTLNGYKDRTERISNVANHIGRRVMDVPFSVISDWNQDIRTIAYTGVKRSIKNSENEEQNIWVDATNALE